MFEFLTRTQLRHMSDILTRLLSEVYSTWLFKRIPPIVQGLLVEPATVALNVPMHLVLSVVDIQNSWWW